MKTRMIELLLKPESQQPQQIEEEKVEGTIKRRRRRSPINLQRQQNKRDLFQDPDTEGSGRKRVTKEMRKFGLKKNKIQPELVHKSTKGASDDESTLKSDDTKFTIQWFQGLALSITNRSIAKPYNSSKVCFDLIPQYADETCGPTNSRHKKDSASFIDPKLWYKKTFITANKLYARKLVKEDPCVMTYVESAYSYVNKEIMESCNQQTDVIRGINDGYRGLELFYHPRSVWIEEMSSARAKVVNFANKTKYNKSNDVDLCIFSEKLTYWDRIIANRMAQADAIAASI